MDNVIIVKNIFRERLLKENAVLNLAEIKYVLKINVEKHKSNFIILLNLK